MADITELANSYFRLLKWLEAADVEKKNTALRSLDRIRRFLIESNVDVVDLTGRPFSEGWAVKVMKMDDSVPENELAFTKMVKPIIQVNDELVQEGEVYVGKFEPEKAKEEVAMPPEKEPAVETPAIETTIDSASVVSNEKTGTDAAVFRWIKTVATKVKALPITSQHGVTVGLGLVVLIVFVIFACILGGQSALRADVAGVDKKVEQLAVVDYRNQLGVSSIVTFEVQNGDNTFTVTQPIGDEVVSTVEINGVPVTITTNVNNTNTEGD